MRVWYIANKIIVIVHLPFSVWFLIARYLQQVRAKTVQVTNSATPIAPVTAQLVTSTLSVQPLPLAVGYIAGK